MKFINNVQTTILDLNSNEKVRKVILWAGFSVVVSLSPFFLTAFIIHLTNEELTFESIFSDGEILIVAVTILADVLKDGLIEKDKSNTKIALIVISFLFFLFSCLLYSICSHGLDMSDNISSKSKSITTNFSLLLFSCSVVTSFICKLVLTDN